jgi:hypothetical protein
MKKYQQDLKELREFKANQILKDDLIDKFGLRKSLLQGITLVQNRTRGKIFEIMGEVCATKAFEIQNFSRQTVFNTPYGKRKADIYDEKQGILIEVKSGYARSKHFTREQVQKDFYILKNYENIKRIIWVCFRGATKPLISYLHKHSIEYFDVEYDKIEIDSTKEKEIIRV